MIWDRSATEHEASADTRQACAAHLGQFVGPWRLEAVVGIGRYSAVYAASHQDTLQSAALSLLRPDLHDQPEAGAPLIHEAEVTAQLSHPGVPHVLDAGKEDGAPYMVTELLLGQPATALVPGADPALSVERVTWLGCHALDVLVSAHARGLLHGNIRPESLFITDDGVFKLLDFGGSERPQLGLRATADHPAFTAPEQQINDPLASPVSALTDLWQLGVSLFWLGSVIRGEAGFIRTRPAFDGPLMALLNKAQARAPQDRFQSAAEMLRALLEIRAQLDLPPLQLQHDAEPPLASASTLAEPPQIAPPQIAPPPPKAPPRRADPAVLAFLGLDTDFFDEPGHGEDAPPKQRTTSDEEILEALATPTLTGVPARTDGPDLKADLFTQETLDAGGAVQPQPTPSDRSLISLGVQPGPFTERRGISLYPEEQPSALLDGLLVSFEKLGEACTSALIHGLDHPDTDRHLGALTDGLRDLLGQHPKGVCWTVEPFGFTVGDRHLWLPTGDLMEIPRSLYAAGVRRMACLAGVDRGQLEACVAAFIAPLSASRADPICALWAHDPADLVLELDPLYAAGGLERQARLSAGLRELDALLQWPDPAALHGALAALDRTTQPWQGLDDPSAFTLDAERRARLAQGLQIEDAQLEPQVVDLLLYALGPALRAPDDHGAFLKSARRSHLILCRERPEAAFALITAILPRLGTAEQRALYLARVVSPEAVSLLGQHLLDLHQGGQTLPAQAAPWLEALGSEHLAPLIPIIHPLSDTALQRPILDWLERVAKGQAHLLGQLLPGASAPLGVGLVEILGQLGTEAAQQAILSAGQNRHSVVRLEALGHLDEHQTAQGFRVEIRPLLEDPDPKIRLAALQIMARHRIRHAGPSLVMRVKTPDFDELSLDERRQCLETLHALDPLRAEELALELLMSRRFLSSDAHEQSRELATEMLGHISKSPKTLRQLQEIGQARWKNSNRVRQAAQIAIQRIERRIVGRREEAQ